MMSWWFLLQATTNHLPYLPSANAVHSPRGGARRRERRESHDDVRARQRATEQQEHPVAAADPPAEHKVEREAAEEEDDESVLTQLRRRYPPSTVFVFDLDDTLVHDRMDQVCAETGVVLAELRAAGFVLFVASFNPHARDRLARHRLLEFFTDVADPPSDHPRSKIAQIRALSAKHRFRLEDVRFFDDNADNVAKTRSHGVTSLWVHAPLGVTRANVFGNRELDQHQRREQTCRAYDKLHLSLVSQLPNLRLFGNDRGLSATYDVAHDCWVPFDAQESEGLMAVWRIPVRLCHRARTWRLASARFSITPTWAIVFTPAHTLLARRRDAGVRGVWRQLGQGVRFEPPELCMAFVASEPDARGTLLFCWLSYDTQRVGERVWGDTPPASPRAPPPLLEMWSFTLTFGLLKQRHHGDEEQHPRHHPQTQTQESEAQGLFVEQYRIQLPRDPVQLRLAVCDGTLWIVGSWRLGPNRVRFRVYRLTEGQLTEYQVPEPWAEYPCPSPPAVALLVQWPTEARPYPEKLVCMLNDASVGYAFDPRENTWTELSAAPFVWDQHKVF